jgi:hypothetical protein
VASALLQKKSATFPCRMEGAEDIKRCARRREREECRREGAGVVGTLGNSKVLPAAMADSSESIR